MSPGTFWDTTSILTSSEPIFCCCITECRPQGLVYLPRTRKHSWRKIKCPNHHIVCFFFISPPYITSVPLCQLVTQGNYVHDTFWSTCCGASDGSCCDHVTKMSLCGCTVVLDCRPYPVYKRTLCPFYMGTYCLVRNVISSQRRWTWTMDANIASCQCFALLLTSDCFPLTSSVIALCAIVFYWVILLLNSETATSWKTIEL